MAKWLLDDTVDGAIYTIAKDREVKWSWQIGDKPSDTDTVESVGTVMLEVGLECWAMAGDTSTCMSAPTS